MASLRYEGVRKVFGDEAVAMAGVTLDVEDGEFMVFVGPSGSGKSTFLRVMAGLEAPTEGRVLVDGEDVTDLEPQKRDLAMVFQAYALYPHKSVRENLEFGLRMRGVDEARRRERVERVARTLGIAELLDRKPRQLSGGQRQRVALGRALVREPKAFLLDEPLSNLDPGLRHHARTELARLHRSLRATFLYVTHDQEEAMTLGDRVAVLRGGRVQQVATPMELYRSPANRFVGEFIGSPTMNVLRCAVTRDPARGGGVRLGGPGFGVSLDEAPVPPGLGDHVLLGVRPHDARRVEAMVDPGGGHRATAGETAEADVIGEVELVEPRGSDVSVELGVTRRRATGVDDTEPTRLRIVLPPDETVREGDRMAVRFRRDRLHFFDPEDETRLG